MSLLAWPLERNQIRRDIPNHAFGMVRNGGARAHQGWDLVAAPLTPCYAIADGTIAFRDLLLGGYGQTLMLKFEHRGKTLYATYCHLSFFNVKEGDQVRRGDRIGYTGNTGNASTMRGGDQHLHFEIRTGKNAGRGLTNRIDPATLYGRAPIGWAFFERHERKVVTTGLGLKVPGINVRERLK